MKAKEQVNIGVVPISGSQYTTLNKHSIKSNKTELYCNRCIQILRRSALSPGLSIQ